MPTMSQSITYQVRMSPELKAQASELFDRLGLNMAEAIRLFLHQAVDTKSIPFPIQYTPNKETIQAIEEVKRGENLIVCKDTSDLFSKLGI